MYNKTLQQVVAYVLLIFAGVYFSYMALAGFLNQDVSDFGVYYNASSFAVEERSKNPYANHAPYPPYYYPPPSVVLFTPLLLVSQFTAKVLFSWGSIVAVLVSVVLIWKLVCERIPDWSKALMIAASAFFYPLWFTVDDGQINAYLLLMLVGAIYYFQNDREYLAGLLLGLAAIFKITPFLLVAYFFWRGHWKVLVGALGIFLAFSVLAEVFVDPGINWFYWRYIVDDVGKQGGPGYRDQSLNSLIMEIGFIEWLWETRLEQLLPKPLFTEQRLVTLMNYAVIGLLSLGVFLKTLRVKYSEKRTVLLEYTLLTMIAVLGSGLAWFHQYVIILFPLLLAIGLVLTLPRSPKRLLMVAFLAVAYILMGVSLENQLNIADTLEGLYRSVMLYGAFIVGGILLWFRNVEKPDEGNASGDDPWEYWLRLYAGLQKKK